jgi:hypothetical protein
MASHHPRGRARRALVSFALAATFSLTATTATAQQRASDSVPAASSEPVAHQGRCRDKPLPGSRIKERVCSFTDLAAYRSTRRIRNNEAAAYSGAFFSYVGQR